MAEDDFFHIHIAGNCEGMHLIGENVGGEGTDELMVDENLELTVNDGHV